MEYFVVRPDYAVLARYYGISIPPEDLSKLKTYDQKLKYLHKLTKQQSKNGIELMIEAYFKDGKLLFDGDHVKFVVSEFERILSSYGIIGHRDNLLFMIVTLVQSIDSAFNYLQSESYEFQQRLKELSGFMYNLKNKPHANVIRTPLPDDINGQWYITTYQCPNPRCLRNIHNLTNGSYKRSQPNGHPNFGITTSNKLFYPKGSARTPVPIEVPLGIAEDYTEACLVIDDSLKASAALSRRCLQNLLLDKAGVKKGNLDGQIQTVIDSGKLPSHLADDIDAIRNIGNFAAHPNKSLSTGEVLDVEPTEAEWNLEVLEALFDFYYVQPAKAKLRREALNTKLQDSGKPPMK
jgi:hypothetical protein